MIKHSELSIPLNAEIKELMYILINVQRFI